MGQEEILKHMLHGCRIRMCICGGMSTFHLLKLGEIKGILYSDDLKLFKYKSFIKKMKISNLYSFV